MNASVLSTLGGLGLEMVGAFLLSAEAIGLDTIRSWRGKFLDTPSYIVEPSTTCETQRRAQEKHLGWLPELMVSLGSGVGSAVGTAACILIARSIPKAGSWIALFGLVPGAIAGYFFIDIARQLMLRASAVLSWIEDSSGKGKVGLAGFGLLSAGIILQALGCLLQL